GHEEQDHDRDQSASDDQQKDRVHASAQVDLRVSSGPFGTVFLRHGCPMDAKLGSTLTSMIDH
ncbi:MAG: hypothetical protein WAL15_05915, partial [Xanthobacteraceae bacterium]